MHDPDPPKSTEYAEVRREPVALARSALILFLGPMVSLASCLLPADGQPGPDLPLPPEVDLQSLFPEAPLVPLEPGCPSFDVEVNGIVDRDSRDLRVRWVVNNKLGGTRLLRDDRLPPLEPGSVHRDRWRLNPREDLIFGGAPSPDALPPVLSFFVTDAPEWAEPPPPPGSARPDVALDLGRLDRRDGGVGSVAEVRWFFVFGAFGCP